jgi:lipoprotein-anchoring transpeptidase ErfK/SrfK
MNRFLRSTAYLLGLVSVACFQSSCTSTKTVAKSNHSTNYDPPATKPTNPSALRVKISTGAQKLYVVENGKVLMATPCSVGTASTPTPAGNHTIYSKTFKRRRASSPGAGYPMTYWCEFKTGYGIHWGFVKPYPCTHGCVRMPKWAAAKLFHMIPTGTPLNVASSQPEDQTAGKNLPVLDDTTLPDPPNSYMMSDQVFQDAVYKGNMFN